MRWSLLTVNVWMPVAVLIWCSLGKIGLMSFHDFYEEKKNVFQDVAKAQKSVLQWSCPPFHCKYVYFPTARIFLVPGFFKFPCPFKVVSCFLFYFCPPSFPLPSLFCSWESVTKSKLTLLTTWQANKSGDKVLRQGIATLFGKQGIREDGRLMS